MSYSVIVVPHPLKPNKRVRVEVPDNLSAKDAKNAIEWSLLAKYGRVAPCQQQHVRHDQYQSVVENDQAPYRETMGWGVQESLQNLMEPIPGCGELDAPPPWQWRQGQLKGPHMCNIELD
jgi:hypothetical protein